METGNSPDPRENTGDVSVFLKVLQSWKGVIGIFLVARSRRQLELAFISQEREGSL